MNTLALAGQTNETIAQIVQCERHMVGVWRRRSTRVFQRLVLVECGEKSSALPRAIERLLSDSPRSGWAGKFSGEQVTQIIAVACEPPEKCGRPVTHWTPREFAGKLLCWDGENGKVKSTVNEVYQFVQDRVLGFGSAS